MDEPNPYALRDELKRTFRLLTVATVVLYLALAGLGLVGYIDATHRRAEIQEIALSTNTALCALRADLHRRVQNAVEFLEKNPEGFPGIPPAVIRQDIQSQRSAIDALKVIDCGASD